jgi:diaminopimelate decarboxylase
LLEQLKDKGIDITHLDLGGGVGIDYEGEQTIDVKAYVDAIISKVGLTDVRAVARLYQVRLKMALLR